MTNSRTTFPSQTGDLMDLVTVEPSAFPRVWNVVSTVTGKHVGHVVDTERGYVAFQADGEEGDWELGVRYAFDHAVDLVLPYAPVL